jgi:predicted metal-dependent phosphoesterase TrpH
MTSEAGGAFVDLHTHTTASDGILAPEQVVEAAAAAGLKAIAITDHDTIDGVARAEAAGARLGIRIVPGVELSAVVADHEVHILALNVIRLDRIAERLASLREMRIGRAKQIVEKLNAVGVPITFEEVLVAAGGGAVGRPHVARVMIERGFATDLRDAFHKYLRAGGRAYVAKDKLSVADAVSIAHEAGAVAVWAHPSQAGRRERLEPMVAAGLDGVEVLHPSHGSEDIARLRALTDFFALLPSGGSDWHGVNDSARQLGMMNVPMEWLERQDAHRAKNSAEAIS